MSALWMFPALIAVILTGFPVALTMMALAVVFGLHSFGFEGLQYQFIQKIEEVATAQVLAAVPLFIFMGAMFEASGIASRLFDAIHMWTRRIPGGLAVGTVIMCVIFAATSGVVGATETVVGLLAIPAMLKYGYSKSLISGTICAGGSLGTIIPPSVLAVVIGPVANASVGNILLGMFIPGFMLAGAYIIYIVILCTLRPDYGPRIPRAPDEPSLGAKLVLSGKVLVPPVVVIIAVLGSMMAGIATPTEASATGALGTVLLAIAYRRLTTAVLIEFDHAHRAHHGDDPDHRRLRPDVRRRVRRLGRPGNPSELPEGFQRRPVGTAVPGDVHRLPRRLHARAAGDHPDGGADHHAADRGGGLRQGVVLRPVPGHAADRLPDAADGAVDLLSARHRPARDHSAAHVYRHMAVHRPAAAGGRHCWSTSPRP